RSPVEFESPGHAAEPMAFQYRDPDIHIAIVCLSPGLLLCPEELWKPHLAPPPDWFVENGQEPLRSRHCIEVDELCSGTSIEYPVGIVIVADIGLMDGLPLTPL